MSALTESIRTQVRALVNQNAVRVRCYMNARDYIRLMDEYPDLFVCSDPPKRALFYGCEIFVHPDFFDGEPQVRGWN